MSEKKTYNVELHRIRKIPVEAENTNELLKKIQRDYPNEKLYSFEVKK